MQTESNKRKKVKKVRQLIDVFLYAQIDNSLSKLITLFRNGSLHAVHLVRVLIYWQRN